jgi:hypothetical protein
MTSNARLIITTMVASATACRFYLHLMPSSACKSLAEAFQGSHTMGKARPMGLF